jgi:hypothetical protein
MKPIRSEQHRDFVNDPWGGGPRIMEERATAHVLTDAGGIHSSHATAKTACVCGCVGPVGGFCAVCGGAVCARCFTFCACCRKPLCPRHGVQLDPSEAQPAWACGQCGSVRSRQRLLRRLGRAILFPFVEFDNHERR